MIPLIKMSIIERSMRQNLFLSGLPLLLFLFSYSTARSQDIQEPPNTGLDSCVDFISSQSPTMVSEIGFAKKDNWVFVYERNGATYTDFTAKIAHVGRYDCNDDASNIDRYRSIGLLSHELGHIQLGNYELKTSESEYVESKCYSEGYALWNNIVSVDENSG